ncbi:MAG: glutathione-disulfide reductase [Kofleriaceae bacterium]|nr:glutathione-disulfide reductase [Kofleriaceae bacterium]
MSTTASGADDVDLFVIGGGSGGVRAARIAADHGARVAAAEHHRWGGTCVIRGCVPKKLMVYASSVAAQLEDARGYGWTIEGARFDWPTFVAAKDTEIARLSAAYRTALDRRGVRMYGAHAALVDPHTVEVGGVRVRAATILIATGGTPRRLAVPGGELAITSDEVFHLPALPAAMVVVGGGYIGVEMAHVFAGLGVAVSLVHHGELPLRGFDGDVRAACADHLRGRGVTLYPGDEPARLDRVDGAVRVTLASGATLDAGVVLAAVGRAPATAGLGLAGVGVATDERGAIIVDQWQRTSVRHVHAVGDVTGRYALTPVAIREGHAFADTVFGGRPTPFVPDHVPTAVFAQPPIATVGLSEEDAVARGHEVVIYRAQFRALRHGLTGRDERMLFKLVVDAPTRRVLGVHLAGDDAPEIVQAAAIAVTMGATKEDFDRTVAIHPTAAEELVLLRDPRPSPR